MEWIYVACMWRGMTWEGWVAFISRLKDSEALLRESRAEQSAEAALKTQLAEERRKAQDGD